MATINTPRSSSSTGLCIAAVLVLAASLYLLFGRSADIGRSELAYRVESYDTHSERIRFSLSLTPVSSGRLRLSGGVRASPPRSSDCKGSSCSVTAGRPLRIEWEASPVHEGRHGFAGEVSDRFVLFDADSLYYPESALDASFSGSVTFEFPELQGWRAILPALDGARSVFNLRSSSFVHGPFAEVSWREAGAEHRLFHPLGEEKLVPRIKSALSAFAAFRPLETSGPYTIVLTQLGAHGRPIAGRSWSGGQVFSPAAYAEERRALELLVHRYAHVFNRYPPTAAKIDEPWFVEGWASWVESEVLDPGPRERLRDLYAWYSRVLHGFEQRFADAPLAEDAPLGSEQAEYLHYCKAPLAVEALDRLLRASGADGMNGLMLHLFELHRPIDLSSDIAKYSPIAFERFRELHLERDGLFFLLPETLPSSAADRREDAVRYIQWLLLERADIPPPGPRPDGLFERSPLLSGVRELRRKRLDGIRGDALWPYLRRNEEEISALADRLLSEAVANLERLRSDPPDDPLLRLLLAEPNLPTELMVRLAG